MKLTRKTIFTLQVTNGDGLIVGDVALTTDSSGGCWLEDEPLTLGEARHLWDTIQYALEGEEEFKKLVGIDLADAGALTAITAGVRS